MSIPTDLPLRALEGLEDVPIERGLVGAMGMSTVLPSFRPYVYRGTGEDQIEMAAWLRAEEARLAAEHWEQERKAAALRERRRRREKRERENEERIIASIPRLIAEMRAGIDRALNPRPQREPKKYRPRRGNGVVRPSPGWRAPTGEDIEAVLAEMDST